MNQYTVKVGASLYTLDANDRTEALWRALDYAHQLAGTTGQPEPVRGRVLGEPITAFGRGPR